MRSPARAPIRLDTALDDPSIVRDLMERTAPHYPVQRYFRNAAEMRSQSGQTRPNEGGAMIVAPNFRADWATAEGRVDGVAPILESPRFLEAAAKLFGSDVVRPWGVYSNITWQLPFPQGHGHTDVPAFLGVDRTRYPTWFLSAMGHSGLFEEERVDIATAVAWFYRGADGGFTYWPDGPEAPPQVHEGDIFNTAIMGDNDRMYHRVRPVGARERGMPGGLTLESRLEHRGGDDWALCQDGTVRAEMPFPELRISVSWKAYVYRDDAQRRAHEEGSRDALTLAAVLARFEADLDARGVAFARFDRFSDPTDALHDEAFVELISDAYVRTPTTFEAIA